MTDPGWLGAAFDRAALLAGRIKVMSSHRYCAECGSGSFWLRPDGAIICALDDCATVFGRWTQDPEGSPS